MISIRKSDDRGFADHGWLQARYTFSFDQYHDPRYMGFRALRVINEDRVQPGNGFPMHGHRDMEIITYVLEGALEHKDSMGNGSVIRPGEVQRMSAGTGIRHSEQNASDTELVHLLQIWILPEKTGLQPSYEQKVFPDEEKRGGWRLIASRDGRDDSVTIHQDAGVYVSILGVGEQLDYRLDKGRRSWIHVARGSLYLNDHLLSAGDGAWISDESDFTLGAKEKSELLLFDLA